MQGTQDNTQKIAQALKYKEDGNQHFKAQDWKKALSNYHKVFLYVNGLVDKDDELSQYSKNLLTPEQMETVKQLKATTYGNMAQVYIYQKQFEKGVNVAKNSLALTKNPKVLYRLAICNLELNNWEEAKSQLQEVQQSDHKLDISKELHAISQKEKAADSEMAKAMKKMFI